jgi:hypothetical protein
MTHIPSSGQCREVTDILMRARDCAKLGQSFGLLASFKQAAAALGYALQPSMSEREKALVEAAREVLFFAQRPDERWGDLNTALAAYSPPPITSAPGAPFDGRAKSTAHDLADSSIGLTSAAIGEDV